MTLAEKSDAEILAVADPIMDNLIDGSTAIDHDKHTRDFTERIKRIVTKEYFETVCKAYQVERGCFARRELVAVFRGPQSVAIVWKQWFAKQAGEQENMWPSWFLWKTSPRIWSITQRCSSRLQAG